MQVDDAFSLSDSYLQQCELLSSPERITNLQYRMLLDYTARVERLRRGGNPSKLVLDVTNYIPAPYFRTHPRRRDRQSTVHQPPLPLQKVQ